MRNSKKWYPERITFDKESMKWIRKADEAGPSSSNQADLQKEAETAKKMLTNAKLLISRGLNSKVFADVETGYLFWLRHNLNLQWLFKRWLKEKKKVIDPM